MAGVWLAGLLALNGLTAQAAAETAVTIPFELSVEGERVPAANFEFLLSAGDAASAQAMPEVNRQALASSGASSFGTLHYDKPGDYRYTIRQTGEPLKYFALDRTVYEVVVRVTNREAGGLAAAIYAIRSGTDEKTERIRFVNRYDRPAPAPITRNVQTGDAGIRGYFGLLAAGAFGIAFSLRRRHRL